MDRELARQVATRTAATGVGVAAAGAAAAGVLAAQARGVRRTIGPRRTVPPYQDGRYGRRSGTSIRLALLGDSLAAGLGADSAAQSLAGRLAADIAQASGRGVVLINHAVVGARSEELARQVTRALSAPPQLAVIVIGANDVTSGVKVSVAAAHLADAVTRLRAAGAQVVVATCPDLGTVRPVGPPLKWLARTRSRRLSEAQDRAVRVAGGHPVPIGALLGPEFEANAEALFAPDRYHPNDQGYARLAAVMIPLARELLGFAPPRPSQPERTVAALGSSGA